MSGLPSAQSTWLGVCLAQLIVPHTEPLDVHVQPDELLILMQESSNVSKTPAALHNPRALGQESWLKEIKAQAVSMEHESCLLPVGLWNTVYSLYSAELQATQNFPIAGGAGVQAELLDVLHHHQVMCEPLSCSSLRSTGNTQSTVPMVGMLTVACVGCHPSIQNCFAGKW